MQIVILSHHNSPLLSSELLFVCVTVSLIENKSGERSRSSRTIMSSRRRHRLSPAHWKKRKEISVQIGILVSVFPSDLKEPDHEIGVFG